ncbi:MAG: DUF4224 domain-containing protein [Pseudomonadota bacterium]
MYLNSDEVRQLTGSRSATLQKAFLTTACIPYDEDHEGSPRVQESSIAPVLLKLFRRRRAERPAAATR